LFATLVPAVNLSIGIFLSICTIYFP